MIRHKVNKTVQKVTGQKVATTTISTIVFFGIIIIITAIFIPAKFLIADEILICIATILVLTDNLMLKNDAIMIEDYGKLKVYKFPKQKLVYGPMQIEQRIDQDTDIAPKLNLLSELLF